ncbi:MAG TPA: glycosyltransferase family 87 protein [Anaerolineales bacterium]|nr:glycosyltransferase family 87 protein [Anaerolineales bacterium]
MKRNLIFLLSFFLLATAMFAVAFYVPNSLPAGSDFSALYNTDLALVNRIPIYDLPRVEALAAERSGISPERFFLARFPYPPWYALSTFYLGLLPARVAATLWFELNLAMLFLSVWLLTYGWSGRLRLIAFPLALFFLPVLGALSVGQYDFPILLGTALLVYSLRKENAVWTTLGVALLTFKPHVGALILLSALGWLLGSRSSFGRGVIRPILMAGVVLFVIGFVADPAWIISYPKMLLNYQNEGNVTTCSECASLPVWLSRWFLGGSLVNAIWIALALLILLGILFYFIRSSFHSHELLLSAAVLVTLLASPYLYNYDFLLLLIPFAALINRGNLIQKVIVVICYLAPTFLILLYGRAGNISLLLVTVVTAVLLYLRIRRPRKPVIDFTASAA